MKTKRVIWSIVIMMLLVGLAACGGGGDAETGSSDAAPAPREEEPAAVVTGDVAAGETEYGKLCIACHGPGGEGIEGLGKPFTTSDFLREKNDEEMVEFIKTGRPSGDPLNTTGIDMPPKGGNPALSDDQIYDIIAYIRTLQ